MDYSQIKHLANPGATIEILEKYGFSFRKQYGQNFLIDENVVRGIVHNAGVTKDDFVIEIGPGIGTMTQILAEEAGKVVAVEIDRKLIPILEGDTLAAYDNVKVINQDILKTNIGQLIKDMGFEEGKGRVMVVANLPYYITTPIIMELLEKKLPVDSITVMVQKEVADRMKEGPGSKNYGALSLAVQYYAKPRVVMTVPASCFMPRPNVDSAVIKLERFKEAPVKVLDETLMFRIIRASFNQRRKTMTNSVCSDINCGVDKEKLLKALEMTGLDSRIRGEALDLNQFAQLTNNICTLNQQ